MNLARGLAGIAALVAAGFVAPEPPASSHGEPLAAALAPLGPIKSFASAFLWQRMLTAQMRDEGERTAVFGRALLELHPDLVRVREYIAYQLIVTEAKRTPDATRHDRLVATGLALLSDGLALQDTPELHGALGRLLAQQSDRDPDFRAAAEAWLGDDLDATAIHHLRRSEGGVMDRLLLSSLLLDRGESELHDGDLWSARRDWQEARDAFEPVRPDSETLIEQRLHDLEQELLERGISPADVGPLKERH
jgi:hypothetical protein